ncbi:MAG: InlB B-repeat-containing protein, partial [Oscillospiraceae bacterium]|nr:InlB B-repeat-containing protein [Oscillospiraceae bacterium]
MGNLNWKNLGKRTLSLALSLLMVAGVLVVGVTIATPEASALKPVLSADTVFSVPEVIYLDGLASSYWSFGYKITAIADQLTEADIGSMTFGSPSNGTTGTVNNNTTGFVYFKSEQASSVTLIADAFLPEGSTGWDFLNDNDALSGQNSVWYIRANKAYVQHGVEQSEGGWTASETQFDYYSTVGSGVDIITNPMGDALGSSRTEEFTANGDMLAYSLSTNHTHFGTNSGYGSGILRWKSTYVVNGETRTAYAYTYLYNPFVSNYGITQIPRNRIDSNAQLHSYAVMFGAHSIDYETTNLWGSGDQWRDNATYEAMRRIMQSKDSGDFIMPNILNRNRVGSDYIWNYFDSNSGQQGSFSHMYYEDNSAPGSSPVDYYASDPTRNQYNYSPAGNLAIDTSRYVKVAQIPNFSLYAGNRYSEGADSYQICLYPEIVDNGVSSMSSVHVHKEDLSGTHNNANVDWSPGTIHAGIGYAESSTEQWQNVQVNGATAKWNDLDSLTKYDGTNKKVEYRIHLDSMVSDKAAAILSHPNPTDNYAYAKIYGYVRTNLLLANKGALRTAYQEYVKLQGRANTYTERDGSANWDTYETAALTAMKLLIKVDSAVSQEAIDSTTNALTAARSALPTLPSGTVKEYRYRYKNGLTTEPVLKIYGEVEDDLPIVTYQVGDKIIVTKDEIGNARTWETMTVDGVPKPSGYSWYPTESKDYVVNHYYSFPTATSTDYRINADGTSGYWAYVENVDDFANPSHITGVKFPSWTSEGTGNTQTDLTWNDGTPISTKNWRCNVLLRDHTDFENTENNSFATHVYAYTQDGDRLIGSADIHFTNVIFMNNHSDSDTTKREVAAGVGKLADADGNKTDVDNTYYNASPADPSGTNGGVFVGWNTDRTANEAGGINDTVVDKGKASITFYAIWKYPITLDLDGGTLPSGTDNLIYGVTGHATTLPIPQRTGFLFTGWSLEGDGGTLSTFDTATAAAQTFTVANESATLKANWDVLRSNIWFLANGGDFPYDSHNTFDHTPAWAYFSGKYFGNNFVTYGDAGTYRNAVGSEETGWESDFVIPTPSRNGYAFNGWSKVVNDPENTIAPLFGSDAVGQKTFNQTTAQMLANWDVSLADVSLSTEVENPPPQEPYNREELWEKAKVGLPAIGTLVRTFNDRRTEEGKGYQLNAYASWKPNVYSLRFYPWPNDSWKPADTTNEWNKANGYFPKDMNPSVMDSELGWASIDYDYPRKLNPIADNSTSAGQWDPGPADGWERRQVPNPIRTGFVFTGWTATANGVTRELDTSWEPTTISQFIDMFGSTNNVTTAPPDGTAISWYAKWKELSYQFVFHNENGSLTGVIAGSGTDGDKVISKNYWGTCVPNNTTEAKLSASEIGEVTPPVGYRFGGWTTTDNGTAVVLASNFPDLDAYEAAESVGANTTSTERQVLHVYPVFLNEEYVVTYDKNGDDVTGEMPSDKATYNQDFTPAKNLFTKAHYHFTTWNAKPDGTGAAYDEKTEFTWLYTDNITLYAQWEIDTFEVIFVEGTKKELGRYTYEYGQLLSAWNGFNTLREDDVPTSWYTDPDLSKPFDVSTPITGNMTLYTGTTDKCPPTVNFYTKTKTDGTTTVLPALPEDWTTHLPYYG